MATVTKNLSKGTLTQSLTAPSDGYLLIQMNADSINGLVDVEFQHSIDGSSYDNLRDYKGSNLKFRLGEKRNTSETQIELLESFYSPYLRAKITSLSTTGTLEFVTP